MSTVAEHLDVESPEPHTGQPEHSINHYLVVAAVLAAITGLEVALTYMHIGAAFMPLLLILMAIKFVMVVLEFMHLRHDAKIFHYLFWSGFGLAVAVYIGFLATFKFFLKA